MSWPRPGVRPAKPSPPLQRTVQAAPADAFVPDGIVEIDSPRRKYRPHVQVAIGIPVGDEWATVVTEAEPEECDERLKSLPLVQNLDLFLTTGQRREEQMPPQRATRAD